jgi:signal peptidase I
VQLRDCRLTVDGASAPIGTAATGAAAGGCGIEQPPLEVPRGTVFVIGDDPAASEDSRQLGPVPTDRVVGRAIMVVWPLGEWRRL